MPQPHPSKLSTTTSLVSPKREHSRVRLLIVAAVCATVFALAGCATPAVPDGAKPDAADTGSSTSETTDDESPAEPAEPVDDGAQAESCDWDAPRISGSAEVPSGQDGVLAEVLVGAWQHTHTDDGSGFVEVTNDHRFVFPSADRMLYCQNVPGETDFAENVADIVLNDTLLDLPSKYDYTVIAWDADTMLWDNPVGGGYVYLLQRR